MTASPRPLRIAVIAGEESGDLLGADLVRALGRETGREIELVGVGGGHLQAEGLETLFDPGIIAIIGFTAVIRDLPRLVRLVGATARRIADAKPDCVVTIDSPAFNLRVARKIRRIDPSIPIVKYVCPSVWSWFPGRAAKMRTFTDHVLCLLPFEPAELERLGGPPGTFVGHRLASHRGIAAARAVQEERNAPENAARKLLVLPGSRKSEVASLGPEFAETLKLLAERGNRFDVTIPTVPRVESLVCETFSGLVAPENIVSGDDAKWAAYGDADAALAASGTVSLELALAGVPLVSCYKTDVLIKMVYPLITAWSASLPNLIADKPVVLEYYDRFVRPGHLARTIEAIWSKGPARSAQLEGFELVIQKLNTERPAGDLAAEIVLGLIPPGNP